MIIYLSFAPIEFMGGAEKWFKGMVEETGKFEETYLINVSPELADLYGKLVLKRKFSSVKNRMKIREAKLIKLTKNHFNPFMKDYKEIKRIFTNARLIYVKFEVMELLICVYFGGRNVFKKIIAGIHSPLYYPSPKSLFDFFHNLLYKSTLYKMCISNTKTVHVLHQRDETLLTTKMHLTNVTQLYDGVDMNQFENFKNSLKKNKELKIIYVGELSLRKGTDILCEIIKDSPSHFSFSVIGEGPLRNAVLALKDKYNCKYYGYISNQTKLKTFYKEHDVLLFPSRAESLALVMIEAMNYGLRIVNSKEVKLGIPDYIESASNTSSSAEYIKLLEKIFKETRTRSNKVNIHKFAYKNFSNGTIYPIFLKKILEVS